MFGNIRSPRQWEIVSAVYDFRGKRVLDVGCGYGDLLAFAEAAGATVLGVDHDANIVNPLPIPTIVADLEEYLGNLASGAFDAAFCFSVMPYLKDAGAALANLARVADVVFVECQYTGDGPGMVKDDAAMRRWLRKHWSVVKKIGFTPVVIRDAKRSIWMCAKGEKK